MTHGSTPGRAGSDPAHDGPDFALGAALDATAVRDRFSAAGRVRIEGFLPPHVATALHAHLLARQDWKQLLNMGDRLYELDREVRAALPPDRRDALDDAVIANASDGFQFRYESIRIPDGSADRLQDGSLPARFASWLSSSATLARIEGLTGLSDLRFADAQATLYSGGDFLTGHDDAVAGKERRAAYVLGLTPIWRPEWGGLLLFHGADQRLDALSPGFNCLDIFTVPRMHSVSYVTASACFPRLSITGWLRSQDAPA